MKYKVKIKNDILLSPECFSLNTNIFERIVNKFYPGVFFGKFICDFIYFSKGVRKNVSIISERSSKRCKENRSITLCQKEQSESTVINANFSKSAPPPKKNNNRKPFKKYIRLVFNEI